MKDILQNWLECTVGIIVDIDNITPSLKDGATFIRIFKHYGAINVGSVKNVFASEDNEVCKTNLIRLKMWFKLLDIDFSNDIISGIIDGDNSLGISILHHLYLVFEKKGTLPFVTKQKERVAIKQHGEKFKVSRIGLSDIKYEQTQDTKYNFSSKINEHKTLLEWYEDKYDPMKKRWVCPKQEHVATKSSTIVIEGISGGGSSTNLGTHKLPIRHKPLKSRKSCKIEDVHYVRHELSQLDMIESVDDVSKNCSQYKISGKFVNCNPEAALFDSCSQHNFLPPISSKPVSEHQLPEHVKQYMKKLSSGIGLSCKRRQVKTFGPSALDGIWNIISDHEKANLKNIFAHRLLKQSSFERKFAAKLVCLLKQHTVQKRSYLDLERLLLKSRKSVVSVSTSFTGATEKKKDFKVNGNGDHSTDNYGETENGNDVGSSYFGSTRQRYMYDDFQVYYQNEKKRTVDLHRKLYAEKLKFRFDRHYTICLQTIVDIIDLAIRKSEFRQGYELEVPQSTWGDWKCLFHHEQPIFDIIDDLNTLLFPVTSNYEVVSELIRQDILNEHHLEMYLQVSDDWEFYTDNMVEDGFEQETLCQKYVIDHNSQIPLGYVVHRMLESKYPLPPLPAPADITKYSIMAVVNGIDNVNAIHELEQLLEKFNILVVDINTAINYCLQCYKNLPIIDFIHVSHEVESEMVSTEERETLEETPEEPFKAQVTQTGSSLLNISSSHPLADLALLGCHVFHMMLMGNELPFNIVADIVIHYIKHKEQSIMGWVLVNLPSTLYQASIAEQAFSGKQFPFHLDDDLTTSSSSECKISQVGKELFQVSSAPYETELKISRIVPKPRKFGNGDAFKTYFTMYVTTVKGNTISLNDVKSFETHEWEDVHSESTLLLEQPEKEDVPTLHNFYKHQGIGYDFIYEQFDLNTLKQLSRVILLHYIEDSDRPKSETLFNEEFLHELEPSVQIKWFSPPNKSIDETSEFRPGKSQSLPFVSIDGIEDSSENIPPTEDKVEQIEWDFADFPILDNAVVALAGFWEALEYVYLYNLKYQFFVKRKTDYTCIPYITYLTKQIDFYMNRDDDRQKIVDEFLEAYNSIHQILRSDIDLKCELHLRVLELKDNLTQLCKEKSTDAHEIRKLLINQNWTYQEIAFYTNAFLSLIQIELDRCLRTLEFLKDYYLAMLGIYVSEPLPNVSVSKIDVYMGEEVEDYSIDVVDGDGEGGLEEEEEEEVDVEEEEELVGEFDNRMRTRISICINPDEVDDELFKSVIERMLNYETLKEITPPICDVINTKANVAIEEILKVQTLIENVIAKEEATATKTHKDNANKIQLEKTQSAKSLKKIQQSEPLDVNQQMETDRPEKFQATESSLKNLFDEWRFALKSEIDRLTFRIELLKRTSKSKFLEFEELMGSKFSEFDVMINDRLLGEFACIDRLCQLFQIAIEEKTPINAELIFNQDQFSVMRNITEKPEPPIKSPVPLEEMLQAESFTIKQLEVINERLKNIAPTGVITREAFVKFIYSLIHYSSSKENIKLVPAMWNTLDYNHLELLLQKIFGNYSIMEWRDFLVYCLELPVPVTEDIIDARLQFSRYDLQEREIISYNNYLKTTLWFERELPENPFMALHNILAKEFLFTLFLNVDSTSANYMSFLLSFCRDKDPKVGFCKGLSLFMGRCVIVYEEDLYLEHVLTDYINSEVKVAKEILNEIIHDVVNNSMSGVTESISDAPQSVNFDNLEPFHGDDGVLTETMYHQFFRKFSILRWTSRVPNTIISAMLCVVYFTVYIPQYIFLYPDIFNALHSHMLLHTDKDIYIPDFLELWWVNVMFDQVRKFTAFSLTKVVKEIIDQHEQ